MYNIPVENHDGGWERTEFPDQDDDQELRDAQSQVQVISSPHGRFLSRPSGSCLLRQASAVFLGVLHLWIMSMLTSLP